MKEDFDPIKTGKELKARREEKRVGVRQVALKFEKSERTILRWESGNGLTHFIAKNYFIYLQRIRAVK